MTWPAKLVLWLWGLLVVGVLIMLAVWAVSAAVEKAWRFVRGLRSSTPASSSRSGSHVNTTTVSRRWAPTPDSDYEDWLARQEDIGAEMNEREQR